MNIEYIYQIYRKFPLITTDSRVCPENSIFFALKGDNFNGNCFAQAALYKGCAYAVVDEAEFAGGEHIILVENVLETLQKLANLHRKTLGTKIIGITGTNGKTTTKELIASVLSQKFNTHYTQGNLNNHIGVPLTLLQLTGEHEIAVVEMGANHLHEIAGLCAIAEPNFGIITNVGKAHLEGFGSFENIIKTKGELYDFIRKNGGKIFINADNPYLTEIAKGIPQVEYSPPKSPLKGELKGGTTFENTTALTSPISVAERSRSTGGLGGVFLKIKIGNIDIQTNLIGAYNAENVLAAACIGQYFGVSPEKIKFALENYKPSNNRSQYFETQRNKLIIDAYNANPTSMAAAIDNFSKMEVNKKIVILGDMRELGEDSQKEHQKIVHLLEKCNFDHCFLIGESFSKTRTCFHTFPNTDGFIQYLKEQDFRDFYILIKGSRGMKMEKTIELL